MRIALDTSFLVALIDSRDKWHHDALAVRDALKHANAETYYLDCVINETVSVLARRLTEQKRAEEFPSLLDRLERALLMAEVTWISPQIPQLFQQILDLVRTHRGALNFHDALICLSCRALQVPYIASFDRDFDAIDWLTRVDGPGEVLGI